MSIQNAKFTSTEFTGKDIASLPDNPSAEGISAAELKARFDNVGKMMVALGKHNALIDALTSSVAGDSGAKGIGVEAIAGVAGVDVQTVLANLKALSAADKAELLAKYADYVPKTDISQVLGATSTKIPSEKAVTDAMSSAGYGDMLKAVYDAGGSGVVDDAERLGGQLPAYYLPQTINNANGTAIKFADGTMICTRKVFAAKVTTEADGAVYAGAMSIGDFAQVFAETPVVSISIENMGGDQGIKNIGGITVRGVGSVGLWRSVTASFVCTAHVTAIGRWK